MPYDAIRVILGHTDPGSTRFYTKMSIEDLRTCALAVPPPSGLFAEYLKRGEHMKQSSLPFSSIFADEMRQYLELAESADKVTESYYYTFKRLDDFIVKQNYQEKILSADIQYAWINTLDTSSRSRAGEASRLRQFARYLNALGIPAIEIESVRVSSDYVAHNFTDDEIARIIDAADNLISHMNVFVVKEYFPLILRILIGCGMRITEVLELRWTDINLDTGVITVVNAKNKRQRFVPMH